MADIQSRPGDQDIVAQLLAQRAISPDSAVPLGGLTQKVPATLNALLMSGVIREAAPGRYFAAEWPERTSERSPIVRVAMTVAFWALLIGIPLILIPLASR